MIPFYHVDQAVMIDCNSDDLFVRTTGNQTVGQSLILYCCVNTVRPIVNLVNFTWSSNSEVLRATNQTNQTQDQYNILQLNTAHDGQVYKCEVIINATPLVTASGTIELDLTGK